MAVNPTPRRPMVLLAPAKSDYFTEMANKQGGWLEGRLRGAINRELAQSVRFRTARGGQPDGEIVFDSVRHGLIEVSANHYVVTLTAEVTLYKGGGNARSRSSESRTVGHREISTNSGEMHTIEEFEDARIYEQGLDSAVDKLALELVHDL